MDYNWLTGQHSKTWDLMRQDGARIYNLGSRGELAGFQS